MFELPEVPFDDAAWTFVLLMAIVLLVPIVAQRIRVPGIVGLVIAGMVVGPGLVGLLEYEGAMRILGEAGLLYLMYLAGLEMDLDEFSERRGHSLRFGTMGFVLPLVIGTAAIAAIGFDILAAILLASCWASHTLLTYPDFRRHGTMHNRAVSTSVGATVFTDTAALLVLVIVVRAQDGELGVAFWVSLLAGLAGLVAFTLWALPRFGRWFFSELAPGRGPRFAFVLLAAFGGGAVAELVGIEAIIGSFLAGLGMNRLVPNEGELMDSVDVLGDRFLIPIFLISVGLLIDPTVMADPTQLFHAAVFTVVVVLTKLAAAVLSGRWFGFEREEIGAMFGLTVAQAAATLAAVIVGVEAGVLDPEVVNPVVVAILAACLVASWVSQRYAPALPHQERDRALGEVVLVPISRPDNAGPLANVAALVAYEDAGLVAPLTVVEPSASREEIEEARELRDEAEEVVLDTGAEARAVLRIDSSTPAGVLHTMVEQDASMLVLGWRGFRPDRRALFGSIIDSILSEAPLPILICQIERTDYDRVVVVVTESNLTAGGRPGLLLAVEIARRLAGAGSHSHEVVVMTTREDEDLTDIAERQLGTDVQLDDRKRTEIVADVIEEDDLLIVPVKPERDGLRGAPSRIAELVPDSPLIIVLDQSGTLPRTSVPEPVDEEAEEEEVEEISQPEEGTPEVEGVEPGKVDAGDEDDGEGDEVEGNEEEEEEDAVTAEDR
jgi:Kef-type K+ transport system membrane component KefB